MKKLLLLLLLLFSTQSVAVDLKANWTDSDWARYQNLDGEGKAYVDGGEVNIREYKKPTVSQVRAARIKRRVREQQLAGYLAELAKVKKREKLEQQNSQKKASKGIVAESLFRNQKTGKKDAGMGSARPSVCLEKLKQLSAPPGINLPLNGRNLILGANITVSYTYDTKAGRHVPILAKMDNGVVTVSSSKGTVSALGNRCQGDSRDTSYKKLAQLIGNSYINFKKMQYMGLQMPPGQAKNNFLKNLYKVSRDTENILKACASENIEQVSVTAQKVLLAVRKVRRY